MTIELPQLNPSTNRALLTNSTIQTWKTCPRKHYLQYVLGLRPAHDADPLRIGTSCHAGFELVKQGLPIEAVAESIRSSYDATTPPPWLTDEDWAVECETVVALVCGWAERYAGDTLAEYVAVEAVFQMPIVNPSTGKPTPTYTAGGKIDGIVKLPDGRLMVCEHKTTGDGIELGSNYWKRLLMDGQISLYMMGARNAGFDVQGVVYDVTRKPSIKPKDIAKKDRAYATSQGNYFGLRLTAECPERETPELYGARLLADTRERPEFYFARMEITRLDSDLKEFQAELWSVQRTIRASELDQREWGAAAWPRNTGACIGFGACQFLNVCRGINGDIHAGEIPEGFIVSDLVHPELSQ